MSEHSYLQQAQDPGNFSLMSGKHLSYRLLTLKSIHWGIKWITNMIFSAEKWSKSNMIVEYLKWRISWMVFGFDNNFSVTISPALIPVTPEGVSLLQRASGVIRTERRSGNTMNESSAMCLTYSNHKGSFISMEKWNLTLKDTLKWQM